MLKFKFLLLVVLGLSLFGCNGARVVDNQYKAAAGAYAVASDLAYVGEIPLTFLEKCTGNGCTAIDSTSVRIVEDIFVRDKDSKVKEFVLIGFKRVSGAYYWPPLKVDKVDFDGGKYGETFHSLQADNVGDVYMTFLQDAGYKADADRYFMRILTKNVGQKTRAYLVYVCSENLVPEADRDNASMVSDILRKNMKERISRSNG